MKELLRKILHTNGVLDVNEVSALETQKEQLEREIHNLREKEFYLGMIIEYNRLKMEGRSNNELINYFQEDLSTIESAKKYLSEHLQLRRKMFGYPANMMEYNFVEKYLRLLESEMYLINSCGGPNPEIDRGNYLMDSKEQEMEIIGMLCKNMNVDLNNYWGYITTGGTESNFWGIRTGFELLPSGVLYYSSDAHYSIPKSVKIGNSIDMLPNCEVVSNKDGSMNVDKLIEIADDNWKNNNQPAIIVLSWGTTVCGVCDNVEEIKNRLNELEIPHYIHLDAAMYGGIGSNQKESPAIHDLKKLNPDSISISFHKYIGSPTVNGALICKKEIYDKKTNKQVEYIGQSDPTYLGSRDYPPLMIKYRISRLFNRENPDSYKKNIDFFIEKMNDNNISFERRETGNTFVIDLPSTDIAQEYQLATFDDNKKAHIIIFPYHDKEIIEELVSKLSKYNDLNVSGEKKLTKSNSQVKKS